MIRKVLFWMHLSGALAAGAVIIMMASTGVVLTYEAQWMRWAEDRLAVTPRNQEALGLEALRSRAQEIGVAHFESFVPTTVTLRPAAGAPVRVSSGRNAQVYLDPYDGQLLGTGFPRLEGLLDAARGWHRWFNLEGEGRRQGRAWTGAANLVFLFLLCSGLFLWIPRKRTWTHVKQILFFRRGLGPRARDFNWHNVLGVWSAVPLIVIAASATVISYAWAGQIVEWAAGEQAGGLAPGAEAPVRSPDRQPMGSAETPDLRSALVAAAEGGPGRAAAPWQEISVTLPAAGAATLTAQVYRGTRGQPQRLESLTLDVRTGQVLERLGFQHEPRARRYRSFLRYAHTGEYWGIAGQTVAGAVSLAVVLLGVTGISMAARRARAYWGRARQ